MCIYIYAHEHFCTFCAHVARPKALKVPRDTYQNNQPYLYISEFHTLMTSE